MKNQKNEFEELALQWVSFGKDLLQDEQPEGFAKITEDQWNWFGKSMANYKFGREYKEPSGTECRQWPRAFYEIVNGGPEFVNKFLQKWATQSHSEFLDGVLIYGEGHIYDLIGYGVQPLFK